MNRRMIIIDSIMTFVCLVLFSLIRLFSGIQIGAAIDYILLAILFIFGFISTLFYFKEKTESLVNTVVPLVLLVFICIAYFFPIFDFKSSKGIQNTLLLVTFGVLSSHVVLSLGDFFNSKYMISHTKMDSIKYNILRKLSILLLIITCVFAFVNTIHPQLDVSLVCNLFR